MATSGQYSTGLLHLDGFDPVHLQNINKREADASLLFMGMMFKFDRMHPTTDYIA